MKQMIIFAFIYVGYGALVCSNITFDYDIKDSAIIDNNKIVYQTLDKLYFINSTLDQTSQPITINQTESNLYCKRVFVYSQDYLITICQKYGQIPYIIIQRLQNGQYVQFGTVQLLTDALNFSKLMVLNNYLVVLTSDRNLIGLEAGKVLFYLITITETNYTLQLQQFVLDNTYFGQMNKLYINDFTIRKVTEQGQLLWKMFLIDAYNGLLWTNFLEFSRGQIIPDGRGAIPLKEFIYANDTTKFLQVQFINDTVSNIYDVIVTTNVLQQYGFRITFDSKGFNNFNLLYILDRYQNWEAVNKLTVKDQYVILQYTNKINSVIQIYFIPRLNQLQIIPTYSIVIQNQTQVIYDLIYQGQYSIIYKSDVLNKCILQ